MNACAWRKSHAYFVYAMGKFARILALVAVSVALDLASPPD